MRLSITISVALAIKNLAPIESVQGEANDVLSRKLDPKSPKVSSPKAPKAPKTSSKAPKAPKASKSDDDPKRERRWLNGNYNPTPNEAIEIAKNLPGGDVNARLGLDEHLLSRDDCDRLVEFADDHLRRKGNDGIEGVEVVKFKVESPLEDIIGREASQNVYDFFKSNTSNAPITQIWIRRESVPAEDSVYRDLHVDANHSVKIYLNTNFKGGEMMVVNSEGVRKIPVVKGTGIAHSAPMVHGTMPLSNGTQYLLYLIGDVYPGAVCMIEPDTVEYM